MARTTDVRGRIQAEDPAGPGEGIQGRHGGIPGRAEQERHGPSDGSLLPGRRRIDRPAHERSRAQGVAATAEGRGPEAGRPGRRVRQVAVVFPALEATGRLRQGPAWAWPCRGFQARKGSVPGARFRPGNRGGLLVPDPALRARAPARRDRPDFRVEKELTPFPARQLAVARRIAYKGKCHAKRTVQHRRRRPGASKAHPRPPDPPAARDGFHTGKEFRPGGAVGPSLAAVFKRACRILGPTIIRRVKHGAGNASNNTKYDKSIFGFTKP